jgi:hypothetical protein
MEKCGHYKYWKTDFDLVQEMGICFLRYGPPIHRTWVGDGKYDWDFADQTLHDLRERDIVLIADLCHFGVPDWAGNFQNPDLPKLFTTYARAFADRYPWIQLYTPVNEMYVCATFSAALGWWNEQLASDQAFVTALKHIVKANVCAMRAIVGVRPPRRFRDVRVPDGQRNDPGRISLLPAQRPEAQLHHGQRLLPSQRAGSLPTAAVVHPARCSAITASRNNTTIVTNCR